MIKQFELLSRRRFAPIFITQFLGALNDNIFRFALILAITFDKNLATAEGTMIVDRTKYGIKYKSKTIFSDIGDRFIYDDFTLTFKIVSELNK